MLTRHLKSVLHWIEIQDFLITSFLQHKSVITCATLHCVSSSATVNNIVAGITPQNVITFTADKRIATNSTLKIITPFASRQVV